MGSNVVIVHGGHYVSHCARLYYCSATLHSLELPHPWEELLDTLDVGLGLVTYFGLMDVNGCVIQVQNSRRADI